VALLVLHSPSATGGDGRGQLPGRGQPPGRVCWCPDGDHAGQPRLHSPGQGGAAAAGKRCRLAYDSTGASPPVYTSSVALHGVAVCQPPSHLLRGRRGRWCWWPPKHMFVQRPTDPLYCHVCTLTPISLRRKLERTVAPRHKPAGGQATVGCRLYSLWRRSCHGTSSNLLTCCSGSRNSGRRWQTTAAHGRSGRRRGQPDRSASSQK